jgi:hypothetical protein
VCQSRVSFLSGRGGGGHSPLSHPSPVFPAPSAALPCLTPPLLTSLYLLPPTMHGVKPVIEVSWWPQVFQAVICRSYSSSIMSTTKWETNEAYCGNELQSPRWYITHALWIILLSSTSSSSWATISKSSYDFSSNQSLHTSSDSPTK